MRGTARDSRRTSEAYSPRKRTLAPAPPASSAVRAGAEDLQVVADLAEAVLGGDGVGPALHGRAGDLDGPTAAAADQMVVVPGRSSGGRRSRRRRSASRPAHRPRPATAACGRPWSGRCCRPAAAARRGSAARYGTRAARPASRCTAARCRVRRWGDAAVGWLCHGSSYRSVGVSARRSGRRARRGGGPRARSRCGHRGGSRGGRSPGRAGAGAHSVHLGVQAQVVVVDQLRQHGGHSTSPRDQEPSNGQLRANTPMASTTIRAPGGGVEVERSDRAADGDVHPDGDRATRAA